MNRQPATRSTPLALAFSAAVSLAGSPALLAADRAGRVLSLQGAVQATSADGDERLLADDGVIREGEVIRTRGGRVQIRFQDGALVSLGPRTRFQVERYDRADNADASREDGGGSVVMELFRGAMRTITGAIGDSPGDEYRMETPVATVGVRGTQYALEYCADDACGAGVADGLYGKVIAEAITVANRGGAASFGQGQYLRVRSRDTPPEAMVRPPGDVLNRATGRDDAGANEAPDGQSAATGRGLGADPFGDGVAERGLVPDYTVADETGLDATESLLDSVDPTASDDLAGVFGPSGYLTYDLASGPSPVGDQNGTAWSVDALSAELETGGGTASFGFGSVILNLSGPSDIEDLAYTGPPETIDPGAGDQGFAVTLEASYAPDNAELRAVFVDSNAQGLLVEFEAVDASTGEIIEGVKRLER